MVVCFGMLDCSSRDGILQLNWLMDRVLRYVHEARAARVFSLSFMP